MMQQLEELGISTNQTTSRTPKPRLETLESTVNYDDRACMAAVSEHSNDAPVLKYHPPTSTSSGANPRRTHHPRQHQTRLPNGSQSANAVMVEIHSSHLPTVPLNTSGNSNSPHAGGYEGGQSSDAELFASVQALGGCGDEDNAVHTRPDSEPHLSVHATAHPHVNGTNSVDSDIHKHGIGAIDSASKYLQKHNLVKGETTLLPGATQDDYGTSISPRGAQRITSPRVTSPRVVYVATKSPRTANFAAAPTPLEIARHAIGEPLKSASACPSPSPDTCDKYNAEHVIFPARSKSEGVDAFSMLRDSSSNQLLSSQPSTGLPPLVRPSSSRPSSATSTGGDGMYPATRLSARRPSPHVSPRIVATEEVTRGEVTEFPLDGGRRMKIEDVVIPTMNTAVVNRDDAVADSMETAVACHEEVEETPKFSADDGGSEE